MMKVLLAFWFLIISTCILANPLGAIINRISPVSLQGYTQCSCIIVKSMVTSSSLPEYLGDHIYCSMKEISSEIEQGVTVPIPKVVFSLGVKEVSYLINRLCLALEQHVQGLNE